MSGGQKTSPQTSKRDLRDAGLRSWFGLALRHRIEEVLVSLGAAHAVKEELQRLGGRHIREEVAQEVDAVELGLIEQQIFFARARAIDVDGREDALVGDVAVEHD